jgi:hypothetical protein
MHGGTVKNVNTILKVCSVLFKVFTAASTFRVTEFSSGVGNYFTQSREEGVTMFLRNGITSMLHTRIYMPEDNHLRFTL